MAVFVRHLSGIPVRRLSQTGSMHQTQKPRSKQVFWRWLLVVDGKVQYRWPCRLRKFFPIDRQGCLSPSVRLIADCCYFRSLSKTGKKIIAVMNRKKISCLWKFTRKVWAQVQLVLGSKLTIRKLLKYGISGNKVAGEEIPGHTLQLIY